MSCAYRIMNEDELSLGAVECQVKWSIMRKVNNSSANVKIIKSVGNMVVMAKDIESIVHTKSSQ